MQLSTKPRYALRILLELAAETSGGKSLKCRELAERQDITEAYLEQIMLPLKRHGLVKSGRGCRGGYSLGRPPGEINVLEIIEIFEGELFFADHGNATADVWSELRDVFRGRAREHTLESILASSVDNVRNIEKSS